MDIMSFIGLIAAAGLLVYGISDGGSVSDFIASGSVAVTAGGTFAALMIAFPPRVFASLPKLLAKIFLPGLYDFNPQKYVGIIAEIADDAKKYGILYLDGKLHDYKDEFIRKGIQLAVDSEQPEAVRDALETELGYMIERHKSGIRFFEKGAAYAPGFGLLGTLSGLIKLLADADDPSKIAGGMAAALITMFYGLILANVIFLPMGNKLKKRSDEEVLCKQLVIEGVVAIIEGGTPSQIKEKLMPYIPPSMRINKKSRK